MSDTTFFTKGENGQANGGTNGQNPWPGLASFEESNSHFFFGREIEILEMERLVTSEPASVLYGRSGLGKTSLLRAGLFPRLRDKNYLPVYVRLIYSDNAPPLAEQVKQSLWDALRNHKIECQPPNPLETLWEYCHREDIDFWDVRVRLVTPVLIFDQFEEIFTLGMGSHKAEHDTSLFLEEVRALINNSPPEAVRKRFETNPALVEHFDFDKRTVKILLCLREDYLPQLDSMRKRFLSLGQNRMRLEPMKGDKAIEAVLKPGNGLVDEEVAIRIIDFVSGDKTRANSEALTREELPRCVIEPALLSLVCRELNKRRMDSGAEKITVELVYERKGEILNRFYKNAMADIPEAVRVFVEDHLLTGAGIRDHSTLEDALGNPGVTTEALEKLIDRRLLRQDQINEVTWIELTHDVLTGVVKQSRDTRRQRRAEVAYKLKVRMRTVWAIAASIAFVLAIVFWFGARKEIKRVTTDEGRIQNLLNRNEQLLAETRRVAGQNQDLVHKASKSDQATAAELFDEGDWGRGLAYLGNSLLEDPSNSEAAVEFWSAVVYGRRGDGRLPIAGSVKEARRALTALDHAGTIALICTNGTFRVEYTANSGQILCTGKAATGGIQKAFFSPNGRELLIVSDFKPQLWNITNDGKPHEPARLLCTNQVTSAAFNQAGHRFVLTYVNGDSEIFGITNGNGYSIKRLNGRLNGQHAEPVLFADFSPDGKKVVTVGSARTARVWSAEGTNSDALFLLRGHLDRILAAKFDPTGTRVVTASRDKTARIWDLPETSTGSLTITNTTCLVLQHKGPVNVADFSRDGSRVITASDDGTVCLWNSANGDLIIPPLQHKARVLTAVFNASSHKILTTCSDNTVYLWTTNGQQLGEPFQLGQLSGSIKTAAFVGSGDTEIATATAGGIARWNIVPFRPGAKLDTNSDRVSAVRFNLQGTQLVTAGGDGVARVWDITTDPAHPKTLSVLPNGDKDPINDAEFSPNGNLIATASQDHLLRIWDITDTARPSLRSTTPFGKAVRLAKFSHNGDQLVAASLDQVELLSNLTNSSPGVIQLSLSPDPIVLSAGFSPDDSTVVTTDNKLVRFWDSHTGERLYDNTNQSLVLYADFSKDGSNLVAACYNGAAEVWNGRIGKEPGDAQQYNQEQLEMARFGPSNLLATAGYEGTVRLWRWDADTNNWSSSGGFRFQDTVNSVEFSPNGEFLAAASADTTAKLWKLSEKGGLLEASWGHDGAVLQATFSPDGQYVATASDDGTAELWKVPPANIVWGGLNESLSGDVFIKEDDFTNYTTLGGALTAAICGYHIGNNGQLRQLQVSERMKLNRELKQLLDERAKDDQSLKEWADLFKWWTKPPVNRQPWPNG